MVLITKEITWGLKTVSNELKTVTEKVRSLLINNSATRDSDKVLLEEYYNFFEEKCILMSKVTTSPDTIMRLRKKIQRENPMLRATEKVQEYRKEREMIFHSSLSKYFKEKNDITKTN
jgi:hypothetical protein